VKKNKKRLSPTISCNCTSFLFLLIAIKCCCIVVTLSSSARAATNDHLLEIAAIIFSEQKITEIHTVVSQGYPQLHARIGRLEQREHDDRHSNCGDERKGCHRGCVGSKDLARTCVYRRLVLCGSTGEVLIVLGQEIGGIVWSIALLDMAEVHRVAESLDGLRDNGVCLLRRGLGRVFQDGRIKRGKDWSRNGRSRGQRGAKGTGRKSVGQDLHLLGCGGQESKRENRQSANVESAHLGVCVFPKKLLEKSCAAL